MSLVFNDSVTYKGICQIYEKEIGKTLGDITGNTTKLKELTADVNLALDDYIARAIRASGTWQFDDSNHTDYPIITTNIVSGQSDYAFTVDGSSNLILDIYKVMVADSSGHFRELKPVDQQTQTNNNTDTSGFNDGQTHSGVPTEYDKTGNGIFLKDVPNYNYTNGLKILINREGSYFSYTDTTKKPGVPGVHHRYFALKPALDYARRFTLGSVKTLEIEVAKMERDIDMYFGNRERDVKRSARANVERTD